MAGERIISGGRKLAGILRHGPTQRTLVLARPLASLATRMHGIHTSAHSEMGARITSSPQPFVPRLAQVDNPAAINTRHIQMLAKGLDDVCEAWIEFLNEHSPAAANALREIAEIEKIKSIDEQKIRYQKFWERHLGSNDEGAIADALAKRNALRRCMTEEALEITYDKHDENPNNASYASLLRYALKALNDVGASSEEVEDICQKFAKMVLSLTGHPTNGTSVDFTRVMYKVAKVFRSLLVASQSGDEAQIASCKESLKDTFKEVFEAKLAGNKKTNQQETEETLLALTRVYDIYPEICTKFKQELARYPEYASIADRIEKLVELCIWTGEGDGDGKPNVTAIGLRIGRFQLRTAIKALYSGDIDKLIAGTTDESELRKLQAIKENMQLSLQAEKDAAKNAESASGKLGIKDPYPLEKFMADLKEVPGAKELQDKAVAFGYHFAKTDIRHSKEDVMTTFSRLMEEAGIIKDEKVFAELAEETQNKIISDVLGNPEAMAKIHALKPEQLIHGPDDKEGIIAAKLFGRMQVVAEAPGDFGKIIIAGTESETATLAALATAMCAGIKMTEPGAPNLVMLVESVAALKALPKIKKKLYSNATYLAHLAATGVDEDMVANSDTTLTDGFGSVDEQQQVIGNAYAEFAVAKRIYAGLSDVRKSFFNGGGGSLGRGGNRPAEFADRHIRAITAKMGSDSDILDLSPSKGTWQGQMQHRLTRHAVMTLLANNLYAGARALKARAFAKAKQEKTHTLIAKAEATIAKYGPDSKKGKIAQAYINQSDPDGSKAKKAARDFANLCKILIVNYNKLKKNPAFSELLAKGPIIPWINLSARPDARTVAIMSMVAKIKDVRSKTFFKQRAIGANDGATNSGLPLITSLGADDALRTMHESDPEALHNMYLHHKPARDFFRTEAVSIKLADLEHAWDMLIGEKMPSGEELRKLAAAFEKRKFDTTDGPGESDPVAQKQRDRETLAWCGEMIKGVDKFSYIAMTGEEPKVDAKLGATLDATSPEVAGKYDERTNSARSSQIAVAMMTNYLNKNPDMEVTPEIKGVMQALLLAAYHSWNPFSGDQALSLSGPEKGNGVAPWSGHEGGYYHHTALNGDSGTQKVAILR